VSKRFNKIEEFRNAVKKFKNSNQTPQEIMNFLLAFRRATMLGDGLSYVNVMKVLEDEMA